MGLDKDEKPRLETEDDNIVVGEVINASGHKQELERQFGLLSICSIGITTGNVWAALGGSIVRPFFLPTLTHPLMLQGHCSLQWRSPGCHLRLHCHLMFLLHDCSMHRRDGFGDSVVGWSVPLGLHYWRQDIWSCPWILRWMVRSASRYLTSCADTCTGGTFLAGSSVLPP
jgi:hypothetical protein